MSSASADLNVPAQQLWMNNGAQSSALELLERTHCLLKQLPDPHISKESPQKGELRLTKIAEEETDSNPYCSAATTSDPQANRVWSGPPVVLQQRGLTVRRKTRKQKEITSSSTNWTSTQRPNMKVNNCKDDRWINPQRWEETSEKGWKHPKQERLSSSKRS